MLIGYARVSTEDQDPQYQLDALKAAGCVQVFQDRTSGATLSRAGLDQALAARLHARRLEAGSRRPHLARNRTDHCRPRPARYRVPIAHRVGRQDGRADGV